LNDGNILNGLESVKKKRIKKFGMRLSNLNNINLTEIKESIKMEKVELSDDSSN
jgi:hypothetical protein